MEASSVFVQQLINGLSLGSIYALIALGYTMVYGIVLLLNFAHGDILMVGAYAAFFVLSSFGTNLVAMIIAFCVAIFFCVIIALLMERFAYRPLREAPRINSLITAIGVSLILENGARVLPFIGPNPRQFPVIDTVSINLGFVAISNIQLIVLITSIVCMVGLNIIVNYTKTGKAMRAVSFDMKAASLMGISADKTIAFTFAIGAVLAAVGGVLYASAYPQIDPLMGMMPGLKAFVAAVLGGIGSIPGAMLGGYILGVAETMTKGYLSSQFADAISFSILIIILLFKPTGLMGKKMNEKV
ncbi:MAG TPA: branched-chain amino acid ABC transporter permease [Treponemataceae bacterium]|nr:branched-chain amino acid ABC transporter permease [Treponemataceae bacterium]